MRRPSPATVIACIALFFALGGTAIAAGQLARNSVGTPQLRNNAVVSAKVKDGSLLAKDFASGQLPRGAQGAPGDTGPPGPPGAPGAPGVDTLSSAEGARRTTPLTLQAGAVQEILRLDTPVVVTERSRLVAQITVGMYKIAADAAVKSRVNCTAQIDNPDDPGEPLSLTVPIYQTLDTAPSNTLTDGSITSTGSLFVNAGSYRPWITCVNYEDAGAGYIGEVLLYGAALDVFAVPNPASG